MGSVVSRCIGRDALQVRSELFLVLAGKPFEDHLIDVIVER